MTKPKKTLNDSAVNKEIQALEKKNELINLENFYVNGKLENMEQIVEMKKNELVDKINEFQSQENYMAKMNPYLVSTYFFKTINPLTSVEPEYSPEKLAIVWDLYMYLIEQVNMNICVLQPTISHFCKFAGISVNTFKNYKTRGTYEMQVLANKISDTTFDSNILLAQNNVLKDRSTIMRVKVENEVQEKPQVRVNVNVNEEIDLDQIASRLKEISSFKSTKSNLKEPIEVEKYE